MVKDGNTEKTDNKSAFDRGKAVGPCRGVGVKSAGCCQQFFECDNIIPGTDVGMVALRATKNLQITGKYRQNMNRAIDKRFPV